VEDECSLRENIQETLELNNYRILTAGNGAEALKLCEKETPDLVLSDIMMPVMDGYTMLQEFQKDPRTSSIPFIFLTAKSGESDLRKGMNGGADDYVTKPFKVKDLLQAVSLRLQKKKKVDRIITQAANNISQFVPHELRTPLVSIMGFTQLLLDETDNIKKEELTDYLGKIKTASTKLHKTIEKFLLFSDLSLSKIQRHPKTLHFTPVEEDEVAAFLYNRANIYQRKNDLKFSIEKAKIKMPEEHFLVLLEEIVDNAVKFSDPGSEIEISGITEDDMYRLEVVDFGIGISSENLNLLAPFVQHDRKLTGQDGTGLGIPIIQNIVRLYNGKFKLESTERKFTRVVIKIPV
jgi:signal transduction histidine kinase